MKSSLSVLVLFASLACAGRVWAIDLPDSCGPDNSKFNVKTEKDHALPVAPDAGKAQIIFLESENQLLGPFMHATVRYGIDGAWVGANNGSSYFTLTVDPGVHHLCANWQSDLKREDKNAHATSFTAQPDHVYYFTANVTVESKYVVTFDLSRLNADEGKYRIKTLRFSTFKPK
jgi:hypothetical protein